MIRALLEVAELPDSPLTRLSLAMKWQIQFSTHDISELKKFVQIMGPMERLFSQLNSELESTIHLCYPFVKVDDLCCYMLMYISVLNTGHVGIPQTFGGR